MRDPLHMTNSDILNLYYVCMSCFGADMQLWILWFIVYPWKLLQTACASLRSWRRTSQRRYFFGKSVRKSKTTTGLLFMTARCAQCSRPTLARPRRIFAAATIEAKLNPAPSSTLSSKSYNPRSCRRSKDMLLVAIVSW